MKALRSILSVAGVLLVASCGSGHAEPYTGFSDPSVRNFKQWKANGYDFMSFCEGKDKIVAGRVRGGMSVSAMQNHEECAK